jgi:hypothetical protein
VRLLKKLPQFNNVAVSATAIANVPIGLAYHALFIRMTNGASVDTTEANLAIFIKEVRVIVDGDVKIRASGAELVALWKYYGEVITAGVLPIALSRPWHRTAAGEDACAYGTADVQSFTVEVDLDNTVTTPTLNLYALVGPQEPLGEHVCIRRFAYNASATGQREISDLPRGPYGLMAMHFATGNITAMEVEANQRLIHQSDNAINNVVNKAPFPARVPQTGYYHVDFTSTNRPEDNLPLNLEDFRQRATFSATGSFNILLERVERKAPPASA